MDRGIAYKAKDDYDRAIADYTDAIRLDPKNDTAYDRRGDAYRAKGDFDHAIADYGEAIRLRSVHAPPTGMTAAKRHTKRRPPDRVIVDHNKAIKLKSKFAPYQIPTAAVRTKPGAISPSPSLTTMRQ